MSTEHNMSIQEMAAKAADFGASRGWSRARLLREFPALGSERTFADLLRGNLDGYDAEAWALNLRAALAVMEDMEGAREGEAVYDTLAPVEALRRTMLAAWRSEGTDRVVLIQGESGSGKTTAARIVAGKYGDRILFVEASDVWADKPGALLGAILRALGAVSGAIPASAVARLGLCQERLRFSRRTLIVDEAHHLGPKSLNTLKTIVNTTPGEVVLLAIPTLWSKLAKAAYDEARQLTTNRLSERVQLRVSARELAAYFLCAVPGITKEAAKLAGRMAEDPASRAGNYAFARDLARTLAPRGAETTVEDIGAAIRLAADKR